jgi:hypothetical protein
VRAAVKLGLLLLLLVLLGHSIWAAASSCMLVSCLRPVHGLQHGGSQGGLLRIQAVIWLLLQLLLVLLRELLLVLFLLAQLLLPLLLLLLLLLLAQLLLPLLLLLVGQQQGGGAAGLHRCVLCCVAAAVAVCHDGQGQHCRLLRHRLSSSTLRVLRPAGRQQYPQCFQCKSCRRLPMMIIIKTIITEVCMKCAAASGLQSLWHGAT